MSYEELKQFTKTERQLEILDAVIDQGSIAAASRSLGIHDSTARKVIKNIKKYAAEQGYSPDNDMVHTAPTTHYVKGTSTLYDDNGIPVRQWVKTDLRKQAQTEAMEIFAAQLAAELPRYEPKKEAPKKTNESMTAYVIGDAHVGMKVSNSRNRGQGDWDIQIAEQMHLDALQKLIESGGSSEVGMFVDVGDWLHANDSTNQTQSGHNLDVDGTFNDAVEAAARIYKQSIDMMLKVHKRVVILLMRGNHNRDAALIINIMLKAFYENEDRVEIIDNQNKFMSYQYGNVLITGHHGDKMTPQKAYEYFTRTMPIEWGNTKYRHCLMGHIHHQSSKEIGGMIFESFNSLAAPDAWHSDSGYGASRSMNCIVYDKEFGEIQRHKITIDQLK